jgi:acetoin utilization protein AcuC
MTSKLAIIYGDEFLRYDFGGEHPLTQLRVKLALRLMETLGLIQSPEITVLPPTAATIDDALLFHTASYVDFLASACAKGTGWLDEVHDTPAFPGGLEASLYVIGGTLRALDAVLGGEADHAFNLGGGLHHAYPDRASGFCLFNDVAVAIKRLKRLGFQRIMYIDVDAHQGDGVMYSFYDDPGVLNVDFHEDGKFLFPGRGHMLELGEGAGRNYKINVPFPPYSADNSFTYAFRELVPPLARSYRPEIILMQCGVDTHASDPLTDLHLSVNAYATAIDLVHRLAHEVCDGRLVMFGGGGYNPASVALGWTRMVCTVTNTVPPDTIPETWREEFRRVTGEQAPHVLTERSAEDHNFRELWEIVAWLKRRLAFD